MFHTADVELGGLRASKVPMQVIEPQSNEQSLCDSSADDDYDPNGYNGMIGISTALNDVMQWAYYSCGASGCSNIPTPSTDVLIKNVLALLPEHNNGYLIRLPEVPAEGAKSLDGQIILGIDTSENNRPSPNLKLIQAGVDPSESESWGEFYIETGGVKYSSAFDTGTYSYSFPTTAIPTCEDSPTSLCPSAPTSIPVDILNSSGAVTYSVNLSVANFDQLSSTGNSVFNNNGEIWSYSVLGRPSLILGMPFFYGRTIFFALNQKHTELGTGPWVGIDP
jgi:hypothetical protein